ncbi:MAG: hypothetical protein HN488_10115, partial [Saprospiraceae bacterium]|nr:hypothetical protein [Saprospiraceae bacterium]
IEGNLRPNPAGSNPDMGAYESSRGIPLEQTKYYVSTSGAQDGNGFLDSPMSSIQAAIDASSDGDTILVQPGTYTENVQIYQKNIVLGSQFLLTGDNSHIASTVIDGNFGAGPCIQLTYVDSTCQVVGFNLTSGSPGIAIYDQSDGTSPLIKYCKINNNYNYGIESDGGNLKLVHCEIFDNYGSGCMLRRGFKTIRNCKIYSNSGQGLALYEESATVTNCLIFSNAEDGINLRYNYPLWLTNSTIASNGNHGLDLDEGGRPTVRNTIITNNQLHEIHFRSTGFMVADVDYSLIEGGQESGIYFEGQNDPILNWGNNNITNSAAMFNDLPNGDYTLSQYAQAIGTADPMVASSKDILGNVRPLPSGSTPDMGAYENPRPSQRPKAGPIRDGLAGDIAWSNSESTLSSNWDDFIDNGSLDYEYAIGTGSGSSSSNSGDNYSLSFDGTSYVAISNNNINGTFDEFSFSAWVNVEDFGDDYDNEYIFDVGRNDEAQRIAVGVNQDGFTGFMNGVGNNVFDVNASFANEQEWVYISLVWSGYDYARLYINGELSGETNSISNPVLTINQEDPFFFGARYNSSSLFKGLLDDVSIWDIALTESQINEHMVDGINTDQGLVGRWNFNSGSGDFLYDQSGNENHGIISGATWSTDVPEILVSATNDNILSWTSSSRNTEVTSSGLTLEEGTTYLTSVRAKDSDNQMSDTTSSNGVTIDRTNP